MCTHQTPANASPRGLPWPQGLRASSAPEARSTRLRTASASGMELRVRQVTNKMQLEGSPDAAGLHCLTYLLNMPQMSRWLRFTKWCRSLASSMSLSLSLAMCRPMLPVRNLLLDPAASSGGPAQMVSSSIPAAPSQSASALFSAGSPFLGHVLGGAHCTHGATLEPSGEMYCDKNPGTLKTFNFKL